MDATQSTAQSRLRTAQDTVTDLMERVRFLSRLEVAAFAEAFDELGADWDRFRRNYDTFQADEANLTSSEVVDRLGDLVAEISLIVVLVRELPATKATRGVSQILAEAAEAEELALRKIRGTFEKVDDTPEDEAAPGRSFPDALRPTGDSVQPQVTSTKAGSVTSTLENEVTFTAVDPELFDAFDAQMALSNASRREAAKRLADVVTDASEETQAVVRPFATQLGDLVDQWERFHVAYDEWRRTEGGCDRSEANVRLGKFVSDFAAITRSARALPGGTLFGPLRELLVEAAEIEEKAIRVLNNDWRPFDVEVYKPLESKRDSAAKLRRHAATGLDALLAQYEIR